MQTPWQPGPAAGTTDGELYAVATEFIVRGPIARVAFLVRSMRVSRQARASEGMVGMCLEAKLLSGAFRTVSVWTSPEASRAFGRSGAHAGVMRHAPAGATAMGTWSLDPAEVPLRIDAARPRLVPVTI